MGGRGRKKGRKGKEREGGGEGRGRKKGGKGKGREEGERGGKGKGQVLPPQPPKAGDATDSGYCCRKLINNVYASHQQTPGKSRQNIHQY